VQDRGWRESAPDSAAGAVRQAIAFTAGGTDTLFDGARLALGLNFGANEIDLRLYTDAGGQPGTVLDTIHASGQMPRFGQFGSGHLVTFDSATHPLLRAGGTYWLLPFASGDTWAAWNMNNQGRSSLFALSNEGEPTSWEVFPNVIQGAFEVNGTPSPAPEPSGLALAGVGLAGAAGYLWRRRKPAAA
jgi:LPXTG-motif cell wall-anchored protein